MIAVSRVKIFPMIVPFEFEACFFGSATWRSHHRLQAFFQKSLSRVTRSSYRLIIGMFPRSGAKFTWIEQLRWLPKVMPQRKRKLVSSTHPTCIVSRPGNTRWRSERSQLQFHSSINERPGTCKAPPPPNIFTSKDWSCACQFLQKSVAHSFA